MVKKKNYYLIFSVVFFVISLLLIGGFFMQQTIFEDKQPQLPIIPDKTAYIEGDELKLTLSNPKFINHQCSDGSIGASAIWVDGKKYRCSEAIRYGGIHGELQYAFVCKQQNITGGFSREGEPIRVETHTPLWGFDYGNVEIGKELIPGEHLIEGYALAHQGPSTYCGGDGVSAQGFFRFEINVRANKCSLDTN